MGNLSEENEAVLDLVRTERMRQDKKWGEQNHPDLYWLGILVEEVGEVSRAVIEGSAWADRRDKEIVQVAAVAVAWMEAIRRRTDHV
jgi:NTP pyrophosphatase (non-canonical NTP hydrolase)